jgi:hypothetical protein
MVTQLGRSKNIKSALKAKDGITPEGVQRYPSFIVTLDREDRRPTGLNQGMPYSNRNNRSPQTSSQLSSTQPRQEIKISPPKRPSTEHHFQYSSRSGKMEKVY